MTVSAGNTTDASLEARPGNSPSHRESHDSSRRSIQFNLDGTNSQPPSRAGSFRSLGWSPSRNRKKEREHHVKDTSSSSSTGAGAGAGPGPSPNVRTGSPPPPNTYERGVSFDTFDNRDATDFSLTLNYKHKGYQSTRRSRTFLCGTDENEYSDFALEWLMDELVDDGDEIVCLRAVERDSRIASDEGKYRLEAEKLFERVIRKNSQEEKAISLVLELAVGKTEDIIQRMVCFDVCSGLYVLIGRSISTSRLFLLLAPVVETLVACRACFLGRSPSTVSSSPRFLSPSCVRRLSGRRRRRSVLRIRHVGATIIFSK